MRNAGAGPLCTPKPRKRHKRKKGLSFTAPMQRKATLQGVCLQRSDAVILLSGRSLRSEPISHRLAPRVHGSIGEGTRIQAGGVYANVYGPGPY